MKCTVLRVKPSNFEAMLDKAKSIFSGKGDQEVTLSFAGGEYRLNQPIAWDAADFPGKSHLRMIGGERVKTVLTALQQLPGDDFRPVEGEPYLAYQFPADERGEYPNVRTLYVNGKMAEVARSREYRTSPERTIGGEKISRDQNDLNATHRLYVPKDAVEEIGKANCIGEELHIRVEWEFKIFHILQVDMEDAWEDGQGQRHVALVLNPEERTYGRLPLSVCNRPFFIGNAASCVKKPGQYAYLRSRGKLLYFPEQAADCSFAIGTRTNLLDLRHFASIELHCLTFTGIEDEIMMGAGYYAPGQSGFSYNREDGWKHWHRPNGAVKVEDAGRMTVADCTFTKLPCDALNLRGVLTNITIRDNRFTHIGGSAIRIGYPQPWGEHNQISNLDILNNYLDDIGLTYENSSSILVTRARNARLLHNTILRSAYSAVSLGWQWNVADWEYGGGVNLENVEVAYNYIQSFVMKMRDGGGIYTLGGNAAVTHEAFMNTMHDNYVVEDELTCPDNFFFVSLYHDGASSHWHTYNNVVDHHPERSGTPASYSARIHLQGYSRQAGQASTEGQSCWHILCENNFISCCKNLGEAFHSQVIDPENAADRLDASRHLRQKDTHLLKNAKAFRKYPVAVWVMQFAGCDQAVRRG